MCIRKAVERFEWGLMNHTSESMEDSCVCGVLNCGGLVQEVPEEKTLSGDCCCDILVKSVADFWPCPKSLPEPKLKKFGLIPLQRKSQNSLGLTLLYVYPWILLH